MAISADVIPILKEWYTDKPIEDVFFRNSPVLKAIAKTDIGGKTYNVPLVLGNGGAAAGDLLVANAIAAAAPTAAVQFAVTPGQLFATFNLLVEDVLASQNYRGGFVPVAVLKMDQSLDSFRKLAATALYGTGFGEIGQVGSAPVISSPGTNTLTLPAYFAYKLSIGSQFRFTNGALPSSNLRDLVNRVTKIASPGGTAIAPTIAITFTTTGTGATLAATDWIEMDGCRTAGNAPLLPVGLPGWLPSIANRTGGTWTTYISTAFYGVDRSVNEIGAAGNWILRDVANSETRVNAIVRGVSAVRASGGMPDMLIVSQQDYANIITEMNAQTTLFQSINTGGKVNKNEVAKGISDMKYAFSTSWVDQVWDDPMAPPGISYIIEKATLELAGLTNTSTPIEDGITGNNPGKEDLTSVSEPAKNYMWLIDKYLTVNPGTDTSNGTALKLTLQMFANFVVHNPSRCCVINLVN